MVFFSLSACSEKKAIMVISIFPIFPIYEEETTFKFISKFDHNCTMQETISFQAVKISLSGQTLNTSPPPSITLYYPQSTLLLFFHFKCLKTAKKKTLLSFHLKWIASLSFLFYFHSKIGTKPFLWGERPCHLNGTKFNQEIRLLLKNKMDAKRCCNNGDYFLLNLRWNQLQFPGKKVGIDFLGWF